MSSKNILQLFIVVMLCNLNTFSQTVINPDSSKEYYKHTIQFYIIDEIIAGYKYNFTESSAFRFIINATGIIQKRDADHIERREETFDTLIATNSSETITSSHFFEIKTQYLYSVSLNPILKIFIGSGPLVNYSYQQYEDTYSSKLENSTEIYWNYIKTNYHTWNFGLSVSIGIECCVYDNINLFAEYEADFTLGWQTRDQYNENSSFYFVNDETDIMKYELKGIRIGAGIGF